MSNPKNLQHQNKMFSLVEQWQNSPQSKKKFCQEQSININTFIYWERKYKINQQKNSNSKFIPLKITENSTQENSLIRLSYPNGVQAEISANTNINIIRSLINL